MLGFFKAWSSSKESLKIFHPNANFKYSNNFNTNSLQENSNHLFEICADLIEVWRKNNKEKIAKRVILKTNKI